MRRRQLSALIAAAGLAGHVAAPRAQPAGAAARRVGVLNFGSGPSGASADPALGGFRQGLLDLGLIEGRNLVIDYGNAEGRPERLAGLVAELMALKPDVIVALGPGPLQAVRGATSALAIVAIGCSDPVAEGWARSLARPGGNVTGLTVTFPELAPKYLELLKQAVPGLTRVAVLFAPAEVTINPILEAGARELGLQMRRLEVSGPDDFEAAFDRASQGRAQGLYAIATNLPVLYRVRLAELALRHRLPSVGEFPLLAQAGFLLSYGADLGALGRRAATYVDKILKGARAGDLPIERPTEFELIVNRKTRACAGHDAADGADAAGQPGDRMTFCEGMCSRPFVVALSRPLMTRLGQRCPSNPSSTRYACADGRLVRAAGRRDRHCHVQPARPAQAVVGRVARGQGHRMMVIA